MSTAQNTESTGTSNTESGGRYRHWGPCTWNNWHPDELTWLEHWVKTNCKEYVINQEVGTNGTPHLQFGMSFKNPRTFKGIKKVMPKVYLTQAKSWKAVKSYCSKSETAVAECITNIEPEKKSAQEIMIEQIFNEEYPNVIWKPWQKQILDILDTKANRRTINWFWEDIGDIGKSYLSMWIALKYNVIICEGKTADILNQLKVMVQEEDLIPQVVILDIPRHDEGWQNYGILEKLKNGLIFSGKYEGGKLFITPVHVFVFANFEPIRDKFSVDRWNIVNIIGETL